MQYMSLVIGLIKKKRNSKVMTGHESCLKTQGCTWQTLSVERLRTVEKTKSHFAEGS